MSTYFRYHVASGHVDAKMTLIDEESLSIYEQSGYNFIESNHPFGGYYVSNGEIKPRVKVDGTSRRIHCMTTEPRVITGLPDDCWVSIDSADPVKATNGSITVMPRTSPVLVEIVGKYFGPGWRIIWDDLVAIKTLAKAKVDENAELCRQSVITPGSGQAMTYLRKADAARAFLGNQPISPSQMQRISDEATLRGCSVEDAAGVIVAMADAWEAMDVAIDNIRLNAKADIDMAATGAAIEAVLTAIAWPTA